MSSVNASYILSGNGKKTFEPEVKQVSPQLVDDIIKALDTVTGYGSIEIYVQDHQVTQITVRSIKKTRHTLAE